MNSLLLPLALAAALAGCTTYYAPVAPPQTVVVPNSEANAVVQYYPPAASGYPAYPYPYGYPYPYAYDYGYPYYPWYGGLWLSGAFVCCGSGGHGHGHGHGHAHGGSWGRGGGTTMGGPRGGGWGGGARAGGGGGGGRGGGGRGR